MLKIAIVGPESSGKTELCVALAEHFGSAWVGEVSRTYLEHLGRRYQEDDLRVIARRLAVLHADDPDAMTDGLDGPTFYDTDTINLWIWSREKYGRVHPEIERMVHEVGYTWRLLCRPDIPWVPDPLRENPHDRDRLFTIWEATMQANGFPYTIIEGDRELRMRTAVQAVERLLGH